ncbi:MULTISPECIES: hypothetical protein [Pseudomonas]|uniref:hypothetical protein n=1 Tax=Pseudomonas TaxID=286 RepID=UPI0018A9FFAE|nr:hypothetical protein [Pseudomonas guariconensis]MBF8732073.1 hypothetical protein [Pseudomonas guariconensis]
MDPDLDAPVSGQASSLGDVGAGEACKELPISPNYYSLSNNPLRQFVFFSYNFPYILHAAR